MTKPDASMIVVISGAEVSAGFEPRCAASSGSTAPMKLACSGYRPAHDAALRHGGRGRVALAGGLNAGVCTQMETSGMEIATITPTYRRGVERSAQRSACCRAFGWPSGGQSPCSIRSRRTSCEMSVNREGVEREGVNR